MAKEIQKTALKKGKAQFNLIGMVKLTDKTFTSNEYDSGWTDNKMYLGVNCGKGNVVYVEMSGGYFTNADNVLRAYDKEEKDASGKSKQVEIAWEDRLDESLFDTISDSSFLNVGVEKDVHGKTVYKKFLSGYDAVEYLQENLQDGVVVNIKGNISYSSYNDNVSVKKEVTSIALSKVENEEDFKATFNQTILVDSSSIGKKDNDKNVVYIDAYVVDYVGKPKVDGKKIDVRKNVSYPRTFELQINEENSAITEKLLQKFFKVQKKDAMYEFVVEGNLIEGQQLVQISADDIPDDIKELIEMGVYTEEEALTKCSAVGGGNNREKRMVITKPAITYVGNGEDRKPTIQLDKDKYKVTDLYFYNQALEDAGVVVAEESTKSEAEETDDEEEDLLSMLENM